MILMRQRLGDLVSDSNAAVQARNARLSAFLEELISSINALGYRVIVDKAACGSSPMFACIDQYAVTIAEFPRYGGRLIGGDHASKDPSNFAAQMVSDATATQGKAIPVSEVERDIVSTAITTTRPTTTPVRISTTARDRTVDEVIAEVVTTPAVQTGTNTPAVGEGGLSSIPTWVWLAAGGMVLFFMTKGGK